MNTTIEVSKQFASTWRRWRKHYGMASAAFGDLFESEVKAHKQREFYSTLPMPTTFKKHKPLENVKIQKSYRK